MFFVTNNKRRHYGALKFFQLTIKPATFLSQKSQFQ
nr:MAG TPA: hypothetical protein [Caudoviricetes sp.]